MPLLYAPVMRFGFSKDGHVCLIAVRTLADFPPSSDAVYKQYFGAELLRCLSCNEVSRRSQYYVAPLLVLYPFSLNKLAFFVRLYSYPGHREYATLCSGTFTSLH